MSAAEGPVRRLLEEQPYQVGPPEELRETDEDGTEYTVATINTGHSDSARETEGELDVTYQDRQPWGTPGEPGDTRDTAEVTARFANPAGNEYGVVLDHVVNHRSRRGRRAAAAAMLFPVPPPMTTRSKSAILPQYRGYGEKTYTDVHPGCRSA